MSSALDESGHPVSHANFMVCLPGKRSFAVRCRLVAIDGLEHVTGLQKAADSAQAIATPQETNCKSFLHVSYAVLAIYGRKPKALCAKDVFCGFSGFSYLEVQFDLVVEMHASLAHDLYHRLTHRIDEEAARASRERAEKKIWERGTRKTSQKTYSPLFNLDSDSGRNYETQRSQE